jgi:hypothetical protein
MFILGCNLSINKNQNIQNSNSTEQNNQYSDENGLSFEYPRDFKYNLLEGLSPKSLEKSIQLIKSTDANLTDPFSVSINLYKNPDNLSVDDFLKKASQNGILILIEMTDQGGLDNYQILTQEIGNYQFREYISKTTSERNAFLSINDKILAIQELGKSDEINNAYNLILETVLFEN